MRKPRMTKSEKEFVRLMTEALFAKPEIRNGIKYPNRETFAQFDPETQKHYLNLVATKTY